MIGLNLRPLWTVVLGLALLAAEPTVALLFSDVVMPGGTNGYQTHSCGRASSGSGIWLTVAQG